MFERADIVIDQLLPVAQGLVHGDLDEMILSRLKGLSQAYGNALLNENRAPVDYTKTTTHIAYLYRTFPSHADWFYKALCSASRAILRKVDDCDPVEVACIGGGPGSEMAAILKFALQNDLEEKTFNFKILDRERQWNRSRQLIIETFHEEIDCSQRFINLDVTDDDNWTDDWSFLNSSIFTFSFFLSEVWSFNGNGCVSRFLQKVINEADAGSIFCYLDNGGDNFTHRAEAEFDRDDLKLIASQNTARLLISNDEQCSVVTDKFKERFGGQMPKLFGNVDWRIWKKTGA
jgi:hypothetical protein